MPCGLYASSCCQFGLTSHYNLETPVTTRSHTHMHKEADSLCHPSLRPWPAPRRRGLAKCCPGTTIYLFQLLGDLILCPIYFVFLPEYLFLLSFVSFFPLYSYNIFPLSFSSLSCLISISKTLQSFSESGS